MTPPTTDIAPKDTGEKPLRVQNASALSAPVSPPPATATSQGAAPAATIVDPPAAAPRVSDATSAIQSLDAQLAELTAELMNTNVEVAPEVQAPPKPAAPVATKPTPTPAAAAAPAIAPTPVPTPLPTPAPAPKPAPNREIKPPSDLLLRMAILSKPLAKKPPAVRTAAGLIAINTLLLAGGVWAYLIMRPAPAVAVEGYDFAKSSLPMPAAEKKEPAPQKPSAGHEGGHEQATKPTSKSSAKAPPKTDKKAPDKKAPDKKGAAKQPAKTEEHGHE